MSLQKLLLCQHGEEPKFEGFWFNDYNPHSGQRKKRYLQKPNASMRQVHKDLISYIRELPIALPSSTSCGPGHSALRNVRCHTHNLHFFLLDLRDAYGHVDANMLVHALCEADPSLKPPALIGFLYRHCLNADGKGLIMGAPASPDLFNLYAEIVIDRPLREIAKEHGLTYTRYLDDLTFSSRWPVGEEKRRAIRQVIVEAKFEVNHKKAKVLDLRKAPIVINGIGVAEGGRLFLPRRIVRSLTGLIHSAMNDDKIPPSTVHGKMGGFINIIRGQQCALNKTEQRLMDMYRTYQEFTRKRNDR